MGTPAWAKDHSTRPEQSNEAGPSAPHAWGRPCLLSAARSAAVSCAVLRPPLPPASDGGAPAWAAAAKVTSGSTAAPRGRMALIRAVSAVTLAGGALTTIAFEAGMPSERATESETTASTPPLPPARRAGGGAGRGARAAERQPVQGAHGVGHGHAAAGHALP